jgi:hypothetical protein
MKMGISTTVTARRVDRAEIARLIAALGYDSLPQSTPCGGAVACVKKHSHLCQERNRAKTTWIEVALKWCVDSPTTAQHKGGKV